MHHQNTCSYAAIGARFLSLLARSESFRLHAESFSKKMILCYALAMLRVSLLRPLVAVFLMAALLVPTTICLKRSQKALCPCCEQALHPSLEGPCCLVRPTQPAVPTIAANPEAASVAVEPVFLAAPLLATADNPPAPEALPPSSPPPGIFILRI
jgi:hypothetical protein